MTSRPPIFRFAPSPNGALHLGHVYSALVTADMAKAFGGRFLLRLEDIDEGRCRPEFERQILEDLAWLGLTWEEPVRRQSEHMDFYAKGLERLEELGLLYRCYATRREIAEAVAASSAATPAADPDGAPLYLGRDVVLSVEETKRREAEGAAYALRLDMQKAVARARDSAGGEITFQTFDVDGGGQRIIADPLRWGDVVIARKDSPASYHLCVVMDDAEQGVSHVTRGEDLLAASDVHRVLQILLKLDEPLYHHHRLIRDETGRKLSKSQKDQSLAALRATGAMPKGVRAMVGLDRKL